MYREA